MPQGIHNISLLTENIQSFWELFFDVTHTHTNIDDSKILKDNTQKVRPTTNYRIIVDIHTFEILVPSSEITNETSNNIFKVRVTDVRLLDGALISINAKLNGDLIYMSNAPKSIPRIQTEVHLLNRNNKKVQFSNISKYNKKKIVTNDTVNSETVNNESVNNETVKDETVKNMKQVLNLQCETFRIQLTEVTNKKTDDKKTDDKKTGDKRTDDKKTDDKKTDDKKTDDKKTDDKKTDDNYEKSRILSLAVSTMLVQMVIIEESPEYSLMGWISGITTMDNKGMPLLVNTSSKGPLSVSSQIQYKVIRSKTRDLQIQCRLQNIRVELRFHFLPALSRWSRRMVKWLEELQRSDDPVKWTYYPDSFDDSDSYRKDTTSLSVTKFAKMMQYRLGTQNDFNDTKISKSSFQSDSEPNTPSPRDPSITNIPVSPRWWQRIWKKKKKKTQDISQKTLSEESEDDMEVVNTKFLNESKDLCDQENLEKPKKQKVGKQDISIDIIGFEIWLPPNSICNNINKYNEYNDENNNITSVGMLDSKSLVNMLRRQKIPNVLRNEHYLPGLQVFYPLKKTKQRRIKNRENINKNKKKKIHQ
eukprot:GHVL01015457.1.p1 GENE.GHVL01015457.1~~GHVL01015457.1.p1  ORF type:complete len:681 (+),score=221.26 GHVL01015457.1:280-2043(+)